MQAISTDTELINDSVRIIEEAKKRGIALRLTGGIAAIYHTHDTVFYAQLFPISNTQPKGKDVDMVTYRSQSVEVDRLFRDMGYIPNKIIMAYFGENRFMYNHPENRYYIEVFFEELRFNHLIDLKPKGEGGRIELDYPTLTIADLILGKLEVHSIEEKDLRDLVSLILFHPIFEEDKKDVINVERITSVLSSDWGFWYDSTVNLRKLIEYVGSKQDIIGETNSQTLVDKISDFLDRLKKAPKSKDWLKRAQIGTKKQWWEDVEELIR